MNVLLSENSPLGVFTPPEDVGLQQLPLAKLQELASTFSLVDVIPNLARMNVSLQTGRIDDLTLQRTIVGSFFSPAVFRAAGFARGHTAALGDAAAPKVEHLAPVTSRGSRWGPVPRNGGREAGFRAIASQLTTYRGPD
jgi:hypothetical protein